MKSMVALFTLVLLCPLTALADDFGVEQVELFPLADMDSEINNTLKTSTELGEKRAVLVIRAENDTTLPTGSFVGNVSSSPSN